VILGAASTAAVQKCIYSTNTLLLAVTALILDDVVEYKQAIEILATFFVEHKMKASLHLQFKLCRGKGMRACGAPHAKEIDEINLFGS
jgi:hypothetical protein